MPSILITTSRRTSNRVRTFIRDLHSVLADSERFNRGSMSLADLIGRIGQSSAKVAFIVSTYKGNPGTLQVIDSHGTILFDIRIKSALLRRETSQNGRNRISNLCLVAVEERADTNVKDFAEFIAGLIGSKFETITTGLEAPLGLENESVMLFKQENRSVSWTTYVANTLEELGPRIWISSIRRTTNG